MCVASTRRTRKLGPRNPYVGIVAAPRSVAFGTVAGKKPSLDPWISESPKRCCRICCRNASSAERALVEVVHRGGDAVGEDGAFAGRHGVSERV